MSSKLSTAINSFAFVCSAALLGFSVAAIVLASDAHGVLASTFPPGAYAWLPSHYTNDRSRLSIAYNRSSEVKTYVAAALTLLVGLIGTFAFGASFRRPAAPQLPRLLLVSASLVTIVSSVCVVWSAVAEVRIKQTTCAFDHARAHYICSIENAACNTLRFTQEGSPRNDILNTACLHSRHARYLVIPIAAVSLVQAGLYAARLWCLERGDGEQRNSIEERTRLLS